MWCSIHRPPSWLCIQGEIRYFCLSKGCQGYDSWGAELTTCMHRNWFGNFNGLFSLRLKNSSFVVDCFALCLSGHTRDWGWIPWVSQGGTGVGLPKRICCTLVHSSIWNSLLLCLKYRIPSHHHLFSYITFPSLTTCSFILLRAFCKFHIKNISNFPSIYKTAEKIISASLICTTKWKISP